MKRGRKVVCGSQEGVLDIFDYNDVEDISDRFPGHPASVDALLALDDDIVLTGSSDGLIRIISILPNKMLGARTVLFDLQRVCVLTHDPLSRAVQASWASTLTGLSRGLRARPMGCC